MGAQRLTVTMPSIEVGMQEGRLLELLVGVGSLVQLGQPLFVVEAEKVTLEIEAPAAGEVVEICAEPDSDVSVGAPVLLLDVS